MPLLFAQLCDLLSALEDLATRDPPLLPARYRQRRNETIKSWFKSHHVTINAPDIDAVALLSALFPAKRSDRVYGIQGDRLTQSLRRYLRLGKRRWPQLDQWKQSGRGDLGDCVERVLLQAEFPEQHGRNRVTLDQVDQALAIVAARCRFSAPKVRARELESDAEISATLEKIYQRLQSREAKWFTRMILKDYPCLDYTESMVSYHIDLRLRVAMQMYDHFEAAVSELRALPASQMADSARGGWTQQCANDAHLLPPRVGTKLGPPRWVKAKGGVKHAVTVIDGRTMSMERKHDGEYCQIHIDLSKGEDCVQIFSKSGKDSTEDRRDIHQGIKDSLRIGHDGCGFSQRCILEGELLVSSERSEDVLEFHKIRKHVSRSGSFLGTALDSQPHPWEHLMIMFYDVMLIDEDLVLHRPHRERRVRLETLVTPIKWKANLVWHREVDFSTPRGAKLLKKGLAYAFVQRWEGLVLKPSDESYFDLARPVQGTFPSRWIKLKKDCIKGLEDTADFAVVGAGYDGKEATSHPHLSLEYTHFYIGCLRNKEQVLRSGAKPCFMVFDKVRDCIKKDDLMYLNHHGQFPTRAMVPESDDASAVFDTEYAMGLSRPKTLFRKPFVFDIAGSGFDKSPNRDIFTLRFPRVMKVHQDRDWRQAVGLEELQAMATDVRTAPTKDSVAGEVKDWIGKLDHLDRGTKGQMPSWDYTDDEDDDQVDWIEETVASPRSKQSRRARTSVAPPLVRMERMDTGEMRDHERRTSHGEVVERPSSKHSMSSVTSDGFLQTPPTSSPLSKSSKQSPRQLHRANTDGWTCKHSRKRSADTADIHEASRELKIARPPPLQHSKSAPNPPPISSAIQQRPLHEITNSARSPVRHQPTKKFPKGLPSSTTDFSFVDKVAVDSDEHIHRMQKRRKIPMEPSSPARKTTASLSTAASTTQHTAFHEAAITASPSPDQKSARNMQLFTPPSTAERPYVRRQIKKLQKCNLILSPCLTNGDHPFKRLLAKHSIPYSLLLKPDPIPDGPLMVDAKEKSSIYVLVDLDSAQDNGKHIWSLVQHLLGWHPRSVMAWDWRLVETVLKDEVGDEEAQRRLRNECFLAKMSWNPDWDGHAAVEVQWHDCSVDRVPKQELKHFRVIDTAVSDATMGSDRGDEFDI